MGAIQSSTEAPAWLDGLTITDLETVGATATVGGPTQGIPTHGSQLTSASSRCADRPSSTAGYRFPGLLDLHVHGGFGWDFSYADADRIDAMLDQFLGTGLTGVLATLITTAEEQRLAALQAIRTVSNRRTRPPAILGIYLEGPFLAAARRGSHPSEHLMLPDSAALVRWQEASGHLIRLITVAPELENAVAFVAEAQRLGVQCAVGHTDADHAQTERCIVAGAKHATHLFNAMRPFTQRDPSAVTELLGNHQVTLELIADGFHVDPAVLRMVARLVAPERLCWISDSVATTGLPDGIYDAYGTQLQVTAGRCCYPGGHVFGGGIPLSACLHILRNVVGLPLDSILTGVWHTPLRILGLQQPHADVIFDQDFVWLGTHYRGTWYWRERSQ